MEIIRYVSKGNLKNYLTHDLTLADLIRSSEPEQSLTIENYGDKKTLDFVKKQMIPIKIIIPDKEK